MTRRLLLEATAILGGAFVLALLVIVGGTAGRPSATLPPSRLAAAEATPLPLPPTPLAVVVPPESPTEVANPTPLPMSPPVAVEAVQPAAPPTAAPAPAVYEWVSVEEVTVGVRQRFRVAVVASGNYSDDQLVQVFRGAMNRAFKERPTAKAVVVFGHSSRAEVGKGADLGSAWASTDRLGWAGDGKFDRDADEGKLYVNIGSSFGSRPQGRIVIDRSGPEAIASGAQPPATAAAKPAAPTAVPAGGTIICRDGYVWPGTIRQGACNGHGGIR